MSDMDWNHEEVVLRAVDLRRSYYRGTEVPVLRGVDMDVRQGEFLCITGSSGSGKSTLLHLLGTLDKPDEGEIFWHGERIDNKSARYRDRFRNEVVGFIFQFYHLLPELTALENVMLPAMIRLGVFGYYRRRHEFTKRAQELLDRVGLSHRLAHKPNELSGGEMQRAAIARALFAGPQLLLADEPTGNLDSETGESVVELLRDLNRELGLTIVMVTHDRDLAAGADRNLRLVQGRLEVRATGLADFPIAV